MCPISVQYTIGGVSLVKLGGERMGSDSERLDLSLLVYVRGGIEYGLESREGHGYVGMVM
jgi:hypothetical protein